MDSVISWAVLTIVAFAIGFITLNNVAKKNENKKDFYISL